MYEIDILCLLYIPDDNNLVVVYCVLFWVLYTSCLCFAGVSLSLYYKVYAVFSGNYYQVGVIAKSYVVTEEGKEEERGLLVGCWQSERQWEEEEERERGRRGLR